MAVEILAPAGNYDTLKAAVLAGADAVYAGGERFGARAYAGNFNREELLSAIDYVHLHGRKLYLTVNTLIKEREFADLYEYLFPLYQQGLDAVIVQDLGVMDYVMKQFPGLLIHASTQMTVTNVISAEYLESLGVTRIVPARELSLAEVQEICSHTGLEVECFVHGALCYSCRRTQREQGAVRPALQAFLCGRQEEGRGYLELERSLYHTGCTGFDQKRHSFF